MSEQPKKKTAVAATHENNCVCFNMRKAARVVTQIYDEAMRPLGFRSTQLAILLTIQKMQPVTVSDLAQEILTDRTTLTRNLKPLEKKTLLKIAFGSDRRERVVQLTHKGEHLLNQSIPLWKKAQEKISKTVGKTRLQHLLKDLSAVLNDIRQ